VNENIYICDEIHLNCTDYAVNNFHLLYRNLIRPPISCIIFEKHMKKPGE